MSLRASQIHTTYCRCRGFGPTRRQRELPGERLHLASLDAGLQCVMPLVSSFGQPSPRTPSTPTSTTSKHTRLQTMRAGEGKGTEGVNREGNERCNESSEMEQSTAASAPYMSANRFYVLLYCFNVFILIEKSQLMEVRLTT